MDNHPQKIETSQKIKKFKLSIDGFGCTEKSLMSCVDFGITLVNTLKVNPCCLQVYDIPDDTYSKIILSILFLESSLVLHTLPENQKASLGIFSSKEFSKEIIEKAFKLFFRPSEMKVRKS